MPIEFRCPSCNKLLRTPDGTAGKQAKCPQCGNLTSIPESSTAAPPPSSPPGPAPGEFSGYPPVPPAQTGQGDAQPGQAWEQRSAYTVPPVSANPYQSSYTGEPQVGPAVIDFNTVLSKTWEIFKNNWGMCIAGWLISYVLSQVGSFAANVILNVVMEQGDDIVAIVLLPVYFVFLVGLTTFFQLGQIQYMLDIARGRQAQLGRLFSAGPFLLVGSVQMVLLVAGTMAGFCLLVVPSILFFLYFCMCPYMLVDQRAGLIESFRMSAAAMEGNKMTALGLILVVWIGCVVFTICTCLIGGLAAMPFFMLFWAVLYLSVTGQATAADRAFQPAPIERGFEPGPQSA